MKGTTIVRWTGRGRVRDLEASVDRFLKGARSKARVSRVGGSLVVDGAEPATVATSLRHMPGVSWIAAGRSVGSFGEISGAAAWVAGRYLRRGDRFAALADVTAEYVPSDVSGAVVSAVLGKVGDARVDEEKPTVRVRAAFDGDRGAVGVELLQGPGGVPTGSEDAAVFVSGGRHSSVAAWMALLSGYRLRLLHAKVDDDTVRAVARLYSELSNRGDFTRMRLEVLEGGPAAGLLAGEARRSKSRMFGGFHAGCSEVPRILAGRVAAPLFLLPQEEVDAEFAGLGLKEAVGRQSWRKAPAVEATAYAFGGVRADVSDVIDGLRRQPRRS